jgi:hypothetical protein
MAANGIFSQLFTTKRSRKLLGGRFTTANTSAPTSAAGDGTPARTGVGTFTVTLARKYSEKESLVVFVDNAADGDVIPVRGSYDATTGVITLITRDISGAAAADTTGLVVNWMMLANDRSS